MTIVRLPKKTQTAVTYAMYIHITHAHTHTHTHTYTHTIPSRGVRWMGGYVHTIKGRMVIGREVKWEERVRPKGTESDDGDTEYIVHQIKGKRRSLVVSVKAKYSGY
jgi:hypothetical protein